MSPERNDLWMDGKNSGFPRLTCGDLSDSLGMVCCSSCHEDWEEDPGFYDPYEIDWEIPGLAIVHMIVCCGWNNFIEGSSVEEIDELLRKAFIEKNPEGVTENKS